MTTDFARVQQLVNALRYIQAMETAFAETGAQAPTISIAFVVEHPAIAAVGDQSNPAGNPDASPPVPPYRPPVAASTEQFAFNFGLPADVAATAASALASAVTAAMAAMNLPTS